MGISYNRHRPLKLNYLNFLCHFLSLQFLFILFYFILYHVIRATFLWPPISSTFLPHASCAADNLLPKISLFHQLTPKTTSEMVVLPNHGIHCQKFLSCAHDVQPTLPRATSKSDPLQPFLPTTDFVTGLKGCQSTSQFLCHQDHHRHSNAIPCTASAFLLSFYMPYTSLVANMQHTLACVPCNIRPTCATCRDTLTYIKQPHTPTQNKTCTHHMKARIHASPNMMHFMFLLLCCTLQVKQIQTIFQGGILFKPSPSLQIQLIPKCLNPMHLIHSNWIQSRPLKPVLILR